MIDINKFSLSFVDGIVVFTLMVLVTLPASEAGAKKGSGYFLEAGARQQFSGDLDRSNGSRFSFQPGQGIEIGWGGQAQSLQAQYMIQYSVSDINYYQNANGNRFSSSGELEKTSFLLNLTNRGPLFDSKSSWHSYWGLGVGYQRTTLSEVAIPGEIEIDDTSGDFRYQFIYGWEYLGFDGGSLSLDYRFGYVEEPSFTDELSGNDTSWDRFYDHSVGITYTWPF